MAGGEERVLRRRIRSVQSTKKITRAMELIAASRIRKAEDRVRAAVPYSDAITGAVRDLGAAGGEVQSPLLQPRDEIKRVAYVVIAADRGLCGGYNANVFRAAEGEVKAAVQRGQDYGLVCVGRKAEGYFRFRDYKIDDTFAGFTDNPTYEDARRIARACEARFYDGEYDRIELVYTRFVSVGTQEVVWRPLVPLGEITDGEGETSVPARVEGVVGSSYEFEPDPNSILEHLLPRYVEARVYAALLNAAASEHAARQRAMKAATDNAEDLIVGLSRQMNRARQDAITTEIMEIVGGAEALRADVARFDEILPAAAEAEELTGADR